VFILQCQKSRKTFRFKQKGQKQASFLAFHKCCQRCHLRGSRYISTSFILVCALHCTYIPTGYQESLFVYYEKFIRLVRIKQKFIRIAYLYSKCTDCRINNNYKLQKHVLLRHQSYLIVFMGNKNLRFGR
jgi:hypothetical protein